ncbi:MAG: hypothetical protein ACO39B_07520 [bacterium]|jgi:hypothetical protein
MSTVREDKILAGATWKSLFSIGFAGNFKKISLFKYLKIKKHSTIFSTICQTRSNASISILEEISTLRKKITLPSENFQKRNLSIS